MASQLNDDDSSELELDIEPYSFEPLQQSSATDNISASEAPSEEEEDEELMDNPAANNWLVCLITVDIEHY